LGLEYRSCCWAIRLAAQDEWKSDTLTTERSYTATIELKGLARLGDTLEQALGLE
jgi:lipopolysaccharide assembly outer membrane protein LptD (OstA)